MKNIRKISFGILTPQQSLSYNSIREIWNQAELYGFESAWLVDHFVPYDFPDRPLTEPVLECWTTLSALASSSRKIRLGPLVSCNSYRSPSLLAKMSSSLDVISNGRLNIALGAGWLRFEHDAYGYQFPKTSERIQRLSEAIDIVKKMWTEEKATYQGRYYQIVDAVNSPKPIQKPHPPVCIGAEQSRMVKFAAEKAEVWNFPSDINAYTPKQYQEQVEILENHCDRIGRKSNTIKRSWLGIAMLAKNRTEFEEKIVKSKPKGLTREKFLNEIVGTADSCAQKLGEYVDLGVTEFILIFPEATKPECLRAFSTEVMNDFQI